MGEKRRRKIIVSMVYPDAAMVENAAVLEKVFVYMAVAKFAIES